MTHVRWMIRRDMDEVVANEAASFDYPWTLDDFRKTIRQRNCIGFVAETQDRVVGHLVYLLHRFHFDIINLCVAPEYRRQGIGSAMIRKLKSKLPIDRRISLTTMVSESNMQALQFFKHNGFEAFGLIRNAYDTSDHDGIGMQFEICKPATTVTNRVSGFFDDEGDDPMEATT